MTPLFRATPRPLLQLTAAILIAGCAGAVEAPSQGGAAGRWTAGFLIVDGVYNTELAAPYDVLEHARHHLPEGVELEVFTVSPDGAPIRTAEGLEIRPHHGFSTAPPIDILVVPSAEHSRDSDLENRELVDWVRTTGERARYVMSLCWGAFVLAEAGLLDGYASTTFPADYARFAEAFPGVDLRFNVSFVHDRGRLTSQGGVRSYDVAMYLVDLLYGEAVAARVGRGLLIDWPPPAGARPPAIRQPAVTSAD